MPGNQYPIFSRQGQVSCNNGIATSANIGQTLATATGDYTGVNNQNKIVFTADATNGSYLQRLRFKALGTNVASVARIYVNNGGDQTIEVNNALIGEQTLPAITAINTASTIDLDYPMNIALNPGFRIIVGIATTVAAGWIVTPVGGDY